MSSVIVASAPMRTRAVGALDAVEPGDAADVEQRALAASPGRRWLCGIRSVPPARMVTSPSPQVLERLAAGVGGAA